MKRLLVVMLFFAAVLPAQAHFIWILPPRDRSGGEVLMVFSDALAPDANVPIAKIKETKLFARTGKGETVPVTMEEGKDAYRISVKSDGWTMVAGTCQYGILAKGKAEPFLLVYYPKAIWAMGTTGEVPWLMEANKQLALEIVPVRGQQACTVLWQGKPAANVEVTVLTDESDKKIELKSDTEGRVELKGIEPKGYAGILAKFVEPKEGKLGDKAYKEVRHYATLAVYVRGNAKKNLPRPKADSPVSFTQEGGAAKSDPAATKLMAESRAARAAWNNFPGFTADLIVNHNGKMLKGAIEATDKGKVNVMLDDKEMQSLAKRELGSLVSHRMPGGGSADSQCYFVDDVTDHPMGRKIGVVGDDMHSSFRIRDRQMVEVNRQMKDGRFTITVLENHWNKDKQYLPISYVVNTWDKNNAIKSSISFHHTWRRIGSYDLPESLLVVTATPAGLESNLFTLSNIKLSSAAAR